MRKPRRRPPGNNNEETMRISGFTIARNARIYDFPLVESIRSVLDIVDEFVVAVGAGEDDTEELVRSIGSPKIRIINTVWDTEKYKGGGTILAQQTDIALRACTGDWCFYIQADEVLHESALPVVKAACEKYLDDKRVDGFVLKYVHLYADYCHCIEALHFAYPYEIRIVRNRRDIHSWRDAQSFKINPNFDGDYLAKEGTSKLRCVFLDARMFHYGWSRDPRCMSRKMVKMRKMYHPEYEEDAAEYHDYGNLSLMPLFEGEHPEVMRERVAKMSWGHCLRYDGPPPQERKIFAPKYRLLGWIENRLLGGRRIGGFRNFYKAGFFRLPDGSRER